MHANGGGETTDHTDEHGFSKATITMTAQKIAGIIILLLGVLFGFIAPDRMLLAVTASLGLMMIFFAKERIDDERVQQLKLRAMFTAMSSGFVVALAAHHYLHVFIQGDLTAMPPVMTAWGFLAGILLIALGLFHYWRWQDVRHSPME
jgi:hypothetical protein